MAALPDSIPVDKVESLVCCSICLERLQDPRTLPCFHSYCKHCLENYVAKHRKKAAKAGKKIEEFETECPCCRTLFSLKEHEEVANMRGSHFIRNMVDVLNAERTTNIWKCSNHSEKASCSRCVSCEVFLCEECLKVHENWSTFKGHVVLTIEELKKPENQSKISGAMRCKEHTTKKLKFYCESCQVLICRYCMDFNHIRPDHVCHPVEKVAEKHRKALQSCCNILNEKQVKGKKSLNDVADVEKLCKKSRDKAKVAISKQKNDIIKAVEDAFERKINEVDHMYAEHEKLFVEKRNEVESFLEKVKFSVNLANNVLEKGSDEEIIETHNMVKERVEMVTKNESESVKNLPELTGINQYCFVAQNIDTEIVSKLFGQVVTVHTLFSNSSILKKAEQDILQVMNEWFGSKGFTWQLCYRASRDGWDASDFHIKCDNKGPTITLVKVDDYVFGGFIDGDWNGAGGCNCKCASMLSLQNKDNLPPFKASVVVGRQATTNNRDLGPLFGTGNYAYGHDLFISKHPPTMKCYSDFGHAYKLPDGYVKGTGKARCLLAGSFNFTPSEIEVFYQVKTN